MRPTHRLDLLVVQPPRPDPSSAIRRLWDNLVERQVVHADGSPGPRASEWVSGGFRRMRIDDPGEVTVYGNRQGGFRVHCPQTDQIVTEVFARGVSHARAGGPWTVVCPACGREHLLAELVGRPPFALGRAALVTSDVAHASLTEHAKEWMSDTAGNAKVILRRG